ncbi:hypothetical protein JQX13_34130 [Archangium violaceum]|uniref:hypothetical protein n=1 Tax=Archangium violaceum TaxID=83451 RepID=UPI00193B9E9C|nr:hypothetical protein [Archangium violaceum]QRK05212.1 hypothetical protein JQX13_34130 [Archangium violaceum]
MYVNAAFVERFLKFIKDRTPKYRKDTRYYLSAWADALQGRDLRKVEPREMLKLLRQWNTAEQKRIAALKAFCSYLIKKGFLDPAHDPSRPLTVPASRPEKAIREKGYAMATIEALYRALEDQGSRDVLLLHAKLGLHESEVQRIAAREGKISLVPGHPIIAGTGEVRSQVRAGPHALARRPGPRRGSATPSAWSTDAGSGPPPTPRGL